MMGAAMDILTFVESFPRDVATEALYYCLRAMKQAKLPEQSKKDFFFDTASSTPSSESIVLANKVLAAIEEAEGASLDAFDKQLVISYTHDVARAMDALARRVEGFSVERGAELLRQMRAS
jgi:hypothetical protein